MRETTLADCLSFSKVRIPTEICETGAGDLDSPALPKFLPTDAMRLGQRRLGCDRSHCESLESPCREFTNISQLIQAKQRLKSLEE